MNISRSRQVIAELVARGVSEFCVCAGARNAPLVKILNQAQGLKVWSFFDERSAAFFALGRGKVQGQPLAIVTTSGTAVAELLPAVVEAHYSGVGLVLLTADRPSRFRKTASPQVIEQVGIFSHYVSHTFDLEGSQNLDLSQWPGRTCIHVNVCFDEPLLDEPIPELLFTLKRHKTSGKETTRNVGGQESVARFFRTCQKPLVLVGELSAADRQSVLDVLRDYKGPFYCEALSGLRDATELQQKQLKSGGRVLKSALALQYYDGVIRIGRVPTLRLWRDLENALSYLPVLSLSDLPFSGLAREKVAALSMTELKHVFAQIKPWDWRPLGDLDVKAQLQQLALIERFPCSEQTLVYQISKHLPPHSRVFLGNSLPIREWDSAALREGQHQFFGNRGVNGIDGVVSTFLGVCEENSCNFALIGDLTALYDLSAPWILKQMTVHDVVIGVINNGGGKIFARMFQDAAFENRHELEFSHWAALWQLEYKKIVRAADFTVDTFSGRKILEIRPEEQQTLDFWQAYDQFKL